MTPTNSPDSDTRTHSDSTRTNNTVRVLHHSLGLSLCNRESECVCGDGLIRMNGAGCPSPSGLANQ